MGERVVVRADWGGRGRASGVDLRTSLTTISTVQDGQITKIEYFFDHTKALAAAGRSEAPMAQENVKLHYQVYEAVNRRDLAALLALLDADVEYVSGLVAIEGGYHGHDGIRRWWENLLDTFPDFTIDVIDIRSLRDLTIATLRNSAHSGGSDKPVEQRQWAVAQWRNNKMIWGGGYPTEAEALESVGLSE